MAAILPLGVIDYLDISHWIFAIISNSNWEKTFFENLHHIFATCSGSLNQKSIFKGTWTRFDFKLSNFIFLFLMFIMINIEVYNAMSEFESQISSYKQDTEFLILFLVNKARILSFFTYVLY